MDPARGGELPEDLVVNTGRDAYFPQAFYQRTRPGGQLRESFRRGPEFGLLCPR